MIIGELYKHVNNTDVVLEPLTFEPSGDEYKVKCRWWNIAYPGRKFLIDMVPDSVVIKQKDLGKWVRYNA